ncbi:Extradiol ring-cleavage dioxygenase, class III enzyme, subunit B [Pseudomassariella vexata]|uniref:Extradiol ring-cleavage dioxygenase, class III enzyme, subunit B n=1 Tax=Pseudomassariella vexata TaxID=1141098 RepID=A0A1Y2DMS5_9PEZI|nr:Extradiol ring-cleavage dioxygenase, class III enzyme, subunit B [Pseudomassariella vexata]ORY60551.1 Extradiol ring-cleavage dioxygenase, class III enzyme, subunit B [Pseudomassariella vexata]
MSSKAPVYFFSHGGPTVMYDKEHPAYSVLQNIGKEITHKVKPKAVVVFSGHWEGSRSTIEVNTAEETDLIYDFYGFPAHYYKAEYPNKGNPELAFQIQVLLERFGIKSKGVTRGLDHGVWAGFHVAFHPEHNPLNCPLVQVSLYHNEDPDMHYRLGQAVASLRDEGIAIIGAGMSVHNLRDYMISRGSPQPMPYTVSFDEALKDAVEAEPSERQFAMAQVTKRPDAKQAHPWMDHLMPVYVAAGAAGEDAGKRTWTLHEGSMAWAQYRFGDLQTTDSMARS